MAEQANTTGRANLYRADGSRRPDAEVLEECGNIGLRLALLDDAMHRRANSTDSASRYPPRLFLSYKWGSDSENAWVAQLAQRLAERGWDVVFDQYRDETADRSVEDFVSRLVTCRVFVAVLSPGFIKSAIVAERASWAFDEMQSALVARSRMHLVGIVPPAELSGDGGEPSPGTVTMPPRPDEIAIVIQEKKTPHFDLLHQVADSEDLERFLDRSLTYDGPGLDDTQSNWVAERLACEDDQKPLREILDRHPFVSDAWLRLVVLLRDRGDIQPALEAVRQALENLHEPWQRLSFEHEHIDLLKRCGDRAGAARAAIRVIDGHPQDWPAHWHLGDLLDDADELWAARSHLLLACRGAGEKAEPHNTLAVVYMGLGLLVRATEELERALEIDPGSQAAQRNLDKIGAAEGSLPQAEVTEIEGPLPGCAECEAIFMPREGFPFPCAGCGASRQANAEPCSVCGAEGFIPLGGPGDIGAALRCPVCRSGEITWKDRANL
jgi:tetratricopeptide (TPR) repeat protein